MIPAMLIASGVLVMWAWSLPTGSSLFTLLTSLYEGGVTMKHLTATSFALVGMTLQTPNEAHHARTRVSLLLVLLTLQGIALLSPVLPYSAYDTAALTVDPGEPSLATILSFLAVAAWTHWRTDWLWLVPGLAGGIGIIGHVGQEPALHHTAALFALIAWYMRQNSPSAAASGAH